MESSANDVPQMDEIDRKILQILREDGAIANKDLAQNVGIAASTSSARVRALRDSGIILGTHAEVDMRALGRGLRAMISVRLHPGSRTDIDSFGGQLRDVPGVQDVFFVSGVDDYLIHVCVRDTDELADFVAHQLSNNPVVASTQTMLVFDHFSSSN